jgi:hypothetical protein
MIIDDVAVYLSENITTLELVKGTNLFKGYLPDSPNAAICVYETGGATPDIDIPTASPTFQILVRHTDYETGHNLIHEIAGLLHQKYNLELVDGETYFYSILLLGEPGHLGRDDKGRDEFSVNFYCKTRR